MDVKNRLLKLRTAITRLKRRNSKEWSSFGKHIFASHPLLIIGLGILLSVKQIAPSIISIPTQAKSIHDATFSIGVTCLGIWTIVAGIGTGFRLFNLFALAIQCIERFVFLSIVLLLIRCFASEIAEVVILVRQNPEDILLTLIAFLIVSVTFSFSKKYHAERVTEKLANLGMRFTQSIKPPLMQDVQRLAVHEAGHALLYAAAHKVPKDLTAQIMPELIGVPNETTGYVWTKESPPESPTQEFLHWRMLLDLAGNVAEITTFGNRGSGATSDNEIWITNAIEYLEAGMGEVYFHNSIKESHVLHNRLVLNSLKAQHEKILLSFFTVNQSLLKELADTIVLKKRLEQKEITPFLERVVLTEGVV